MEFAILIGIVAAGLLGVAMYVNRGFQGRLRRAADSIGPQYGPGLVQDSTEVTTLRSQSTQRNFLEGAVPSATSVTISNATSTTTRDRTEALADNTGRNVFE